MYSEKSKDQLQAILNDLNNKYAQVKEKGLKLDMSRGKPSPEQVEFGKPILDAITSGSSLMAEDGTDCGNYGALDGIPEAKRLMAAIMDTAPDKVMVGGCSSLNLMHDIVTYCLLHPLPGCDKSWREQGKISFLCPSPGYDRHFAVSEHLGIGLITVPMTADGPDMDQVERLVQDPQVKGMWAVPKYSNPTGVTYSDETVRRLANLKPAAKDFRIFWDDAYALHDLDSDNPDKLLSLMAEMEKAGNDNLAFLFASTAKISFAGGGISAVAASKDNLAFIKKHVFYQTITFDKLNQLRHARYFKDINGLRAHMAKHAEHLRPKFSLVLEILERELGGLGIADWSKPRGGYFISMDAPVGCAKRAVALCKEAGVILTPAGATYPSGADPEDKNIRLAPTYPGLEELRQAAELVCLCVKIASLEKLLS